MDIKEARKALSPSEGAAIPAFSKEQSTRPVYNGRPFTKSGLPVGLFHPVFNSFQAALKRTLTAADSTLR